MSKAHAMLRLRRAADDAETSDLDNENLLLAEATALLAVHDNKKNQMEFDAGGHIPCAVAELGHRALKPRQRAHVDSCAFCQTLLASIRPVDAGEARAFGAAAAAEYRRPVLRTLIGSSRFRWQWLWSALVAVALACAGFSLSRLF
jgi:hypothetical protein